MSLVDFTAGVFDLAFYPIFNSGNPLIAVPIICMSVCAVFGLVSRLLRR